MPETRAILHSDMNAFYASVEMMLDPKLRGKAVAVCGSTERRHGIVLAKSELAKRVGVKTDMVNWEARQKCPDLIVVPPQYDQYLKYSRLAHEIYYRYTDLCEPFGMDECWLDVTHSRMFGSGMEIAEKIRQAAKDEHEEIRRRYGKRSLSYAILMGDLKIILGVLVGLTRQYANRR